MRLCDNETVEVYEVNDTNLARALSDTATTLEALADVDGYTWANVTTTFAHVDGTLQYTVTLYVHK